MTSADTRDLWREAFALAEDALALEGDEREQFLRGVRAERPALEQKVRSLIGAEDDASDGEPDALDGWAGRKVGPYRLVRRLGSGGMGAVYEAEQDRPRRRVALKLLQGGALSDEARRRFEFEIEVLGRLDHPSIATLYEGGTVEGPEGGELWYYAMELARDARTIVEHGEQGQLAVRERVRLMLDACDAIAYGHSRGIVHRDLKPGNLLVDGDGQVSVIDYGIARSLDAQPWTRGVQTRVGSIVGTLGYMAPEQLGADPDAIDERCDVYALGAVLHEVLTGRPAIDPGEGSLLELIERVRKARPPAPSAVRPDLPRELDWIVRKCMERAPERRYATVRELQRDLRRFLAGETLSRRVPSRSIRVWSGVGALLGIPLVVLVGRAVWFGESGEADGSGDHLADATPPPDLVVDAARAELEVRDLVVANVVRIGERTGPPVELRVLSGGRLRAERVEVLPTGRLTLDSGAVEAPVVSMQGGTLAGHGALGPVAGGGRVEGTGRVIPHPGGALTVRGDWLPAPEAELEVRFDGVDSWGRVQVAGVAGIPRLVVPSFEGLVPSSGKRFAVVDAQRFDGALQPIHRPALFWYDGGGGRLAAELRETALEVVAHDKRFLGRTHTDLELEEHALWKRAVHEEDDLYFRPNSVLRLRGAEQALAGRELHFWGGVTQIESGLLTATAAAPREGIFVTSPQGATVEVRGGTLGSRGSTTVGVMNGQSGVLRVIGASSRFDCMEAGAGGFLAVGADGAGRLELSEGGRVDCGAMLALGDGWGGGGGALLVQDAGTHLHTHRLHVGRRTTGELTVERGGVAVVGGDVSVGQMHPDPLLFEPCPPAEVLVRGEGSVLRLAQDRGVVALGAVGSANVIVEDCAELETNGPVFAAQARDCESRVHLRSGATWTVGAPVDGSTASVWFGQRGRAELRVESESRLECELSLALGVEPDSHGVLVVDGEGARARVAELSVGSQAGARGRLEVVRGGSLVVAGRLQMQDSAETVLSAGARCPVTVAGDAHLSGELVVHLDPDAPAPAPGEQFTLLRAASLSGRFADLAVEGREDTALSLEYGSGEVVAVIE